VKSVPILSLIPERLVQTPQHSRPFGGFCNEKRSPEIDEF